MIFFLCIHCSFIYRCRHPFVAIVTTEFQQFFFCFLAPHSTGMERGGTDSWARDAFRCLGSFFMQTAFEFEMKTLTGAANANAHGTGARIRWPGLGTCDLRISLDPGAGPPPSRSPSLQGGGQCHCILVSTVRLLLAH